MAHGARVTIEIISPGYGAIASQGRGRLKVMLERSLEIAGFDPRHIVCIGQVQLSTDWPQLLVNASGVLIAALVAIWVAGAQHRRQVLQRTRQDVAEFLDVADRCANHVYVRRFSEGDNQGEGDWRSAQSRLISKMHVVRLTAPQRIYALASSVYSSIQSIIKTTQSIVELEASGDENRNDYRQDLQHALDKAQTSYREAVQDLVHVSVHYSWWDRISVKWKDRHARAKALRKMRRQSIEGCVDGPSVVDRSL